MSTFTFGIPAGQIATFTAGTAATVSRLRASGSGDPYTPVAVSAAGSLALGPFGEARDYQVDADVNGTVAYSKPDPDTADTQAALDTRVDALEAPSAANLGAKAAVGTLTVSETGDAYHKVSTLTLTNFAVGTAGDNASLAIGALLYTLPDGAVAVDHAYASVALTLNSDVQTDTPEIGIGTVVGSGANATLGAVGATSENIAEGAAVADVDGTVFISQAAPPSGSVVIAAGDAHTIYLNAADGWADTTTGTRALTATGTVRIFWRFLGP